MLTRLKLGSSHLREHKFRHNFKDTLNPFRSLGLKLKPQHTIFCDVTSIIEAELPL